MIADILQSTELLEEEDLTWSASLDLPYIVWGHKGAQLNNKAMMTGRWLSLSSSPLISLNSLSGGNLARPSKADEADLFLSDVILQFDLEAGWREVGRMLEARYRHAVSTVNWTDVEMYCIE